MLQIYINVLFQRFSVRWEFKPEIQNPLVLRTEDLLYGQRKGKDDKME